MTELDDPADRVNGFSGSIRLPPTVPDGIADELYQFLDDRQLPLPYVPPGLGREFIELFGDAFGTRTRPFASMTAYDFRPWISEIYFGDWQPRVRFGWGGHGLNSHAYTYQLVYCGVVIVLQVAGGNVLDSAARTAKVWRSAMHGVKEIAEAAQLSDLAPAHDAVLIVAYSDLRQLGGVQLVTWEHIVDSESMPAAYRWLVEAKDFETITRQAVEYLSRYR